MISTVGRFLEHSRIFYFRNGAEDAENGSFFIGSADWMHRNLSGRVEAIAPVENEGLRRELWRLLNVYLDDRRQAWDMQSDGSYVQRQPSGNAEQADLGAQNVLMAAIRK